MPGSGDGSGFRCRNVAGLPIFFHFRTKGVGSQVGSQMEKIDVVALREDLLDLLMARFTGRLLGPDLVAEADEFVRERFRGFDRAGALPILFGDGAALVGYDVAIDDERSSLGLTPRTEFFPSHRYRPVGTTSDNRIALGFCGNYDLWVVTQEPRPPTIVARYGDGDDDYLSANPEILGLEIVRQIGEPFPEALKRLVRLGLLADDGAHAPSGPRITQPSPSTTARERPPRFAPVRRRGMFPWWPRRN